MTPKLSRREWLMDASNALAAAALGGMTGRGFASEPLASVAGSSAFTAIDRTLKRAVDRGTVAGVVAIGATRKGLIYAGSFGRATKASWTSSAGSKRDYTAAALAPDVEPHSTHCADADVVLALQSQKESTSCTLSLALPEK